MEKVIITVQAPIGKIEDKNRTEEFERYFDARCYIISELDAWCKIRCIDSDNRIYEYETYLGGMSSVVKKELKEWIIDIREI